jgi:hypothetical protein
VDSGEPSFTDVYFGHPFQPFSSLDTGFGTLHGVAAGVGSAELPEQLGIAQKYELKHLRLKVSY